MPQSQAGRVSARLLHLYQKENLQTELGKKTTLRRMNYACLRFHSLDIEGEGAGERHACLRFTVSDRVGCGVGREGKTPKKLSYLLE